MCSARAHWANALLFGILMLTALPLYFSGLSTAIGRRVLVENIHVWTGVVLPGAARHLAARPLGSPHAA